MRFLQLNHRVVTIDGYTDVPSQNEKLLLQAVANQPVSVGICGSERSFQLYSKVLTVYDMIPVRFWHISSINFFLDKFIFFFPSGNFHWPMLYITGSRCASCRLRFKQWSWLLDPKEFVGKKLGDEWIYSYASKWRNFSRCLWNKYVGFLSN